MQSDHNIVQPSDMFKQFIDVMNIADPQKRAIIEQMIGPHFAEKQTQESKTSRLRPRLERLQDITEILASALGACSECWGQRKSCPQCRGRGKPGAFRPDPEAYAHFVAPVVRKMTALQRKAGLTQLK